MGQRIASVRKNGALSEEEGFATLAGEEGFAAIADKEGVAALANEKVVAPERERKVLQLVFRDIDEALSQSPPKLMVKARFRGRHFFKTPKRWVLDEFQFQVQISAIKQRFGVVLPNSNSLASIPGKRPHHKGNVKHQAQSLFSIYVPNYVRIHAPQNHA